MTKSGELPRAAESSLELFGAGLAIAIVLGFFLGLLLARVRVLRIGLEPYILMLYATPMFALIPYILVAVRLRVPREGDRRRDVRHLADPHQHDGGRAQRQPGPARGCALVPVDRAEALAPRDHPVHAAVHDDRRAAGDRALADRRDRERVPARGHRPRQPDPPVREPLRRRARARRGARSSRCSRRC